MNWDKLRSTASDKHSKILVLNLWMNWIKLPSNLGFSFENKMNNLHKADHISITMNEKFHYLKFSRNYQWIGKNEILNPFANSTDTKEYLVLGKALNINIVYLMYYPSRQNVKWKHYKYKSTFNNEQGANLCKLWHGLIC